MTNSTQSTLPHLSSLQLYGEEAFARVQNAHVLIIGLGGVGSWAAESLVRMGLRKITLMDLDDVCITNIARQSHANLSNIGQPKTKALGERLTSLSPDLELKIINDFYTPRNGAAYIGHQYDFVIDAIDGLLSKVHLLQECSRKNIRVITTGAAGGKKDPGMVQCLDLAKTYDDPLLLKLRKELRRDYQFPRGDKKFDIPCVFSPEPLYSFSHEQRKAAKSCSDGLGASCMVTASFGMKAAAFVLDEIVK